MLCYLREDPATSVICLILESITDARRFFTEACRDYSGQTGHSRRRRADRRRAAGRGVAHGGAGDRRRGPRCGARARRRGTGAHRPGGLRRGQGAGRPARAARAPGRGADQFRRHRRRAGRPAGRRETGGTGAEPAAAGRAAAAAARLRQRAQPGGHHARLEPVCHRVSGGHRAAGPVGEIDLVILVLVHRAASAEVAAAVRDAAARLRSDGVPVPVYVCWVAPRDARQHADLLQQGGVPCFAWPDRTARAAWRCGPLRPAPRAGPATRSPLRRCHIGGVW